MRKRFREGKQGALHLVAVVVCATSLLSGFSSPTAWAVEAFSDAVGYHQVSALGNSDTFTSLPYTRTPAFVGRVGSVTGNAVTVEGSPGWTAGQFVYASGSQPDTFYLFLASGTREGISLTITNNSANSVELLLDVTDLTNVAAGDRIAIVPYWTLNTAFPNGAGVHESPTPGNRDTEVLIPNLDSVGINLSANRVYYFWEDHWRQVGEGSTIKDDDVLSPESYLIVRHNISSNTTVQARGFVPLRKVQVPVYNETTTKQDNSVALIRPSTYTLDASGLIDSGAFGVSPFPGTPTDLLLTFDNSVAVKNKSSAFRYFYWNGAWRRTDRPFTENRGSDQVLTPTSGVIIRKGTNSISSTLFWVNSPNY